MVNIMFDERFRIAYDKSDEFLSRVDNTDGMISIAEALDCAKRFYCPEIYLLQDSFKKLDICDSYGAMMLATFKPMLSTSSKSKKNSSDGNVSEIRATEATIVLNSDKDVLYQRFSAFHELGHLVAIDHNTAGKRYIAPNFIISTHINYNITSISPKEYNESNYLLNEQIANIFALRVLMPTAIFYLKVRELNNITLVAKFFGVTEDAVMSRMKVGA